MFFLHIFEYSYPHPISTIFLRLVLFFEKIFEKVLKQYPNTFLYYNIFLRKWCELREKGCAEAHPKKVCYLAYSVSKFVNLSSYSCRLASYFTFTVISSTTALLSLSVIVTIISVGSVNQPKIVYPYVWEV